MHELYFVSMFLRSKKNLQSMESKKTVYCLKDIQRYLHLNSDVLLCMIIEYLYHSYKMQNVCIIIDNGRTFFTMVNKW